MKERTCAHCGFEIPLSRNLNSSYCSHDCYYENKKSEAAITNRKKREELLLLKNDEIIHELFSLYESKYYLSAKFLLDKNFAWDLHTGETTINSIKAKKLIRYAYTLFLNQTVQLWKL